MAGVRGGVSRCPDPVSPLLSPLSGRRQKDGWKEGHGAREINRVLVRGEWGEEGQRGIEEVSERKIMRNNRKFSIKKIVNGVRKGRCA